MPTTRSRAIKQKRAASFDSEVQRAGESSSSENDPMSVSTATIEEHLKQAQLGLGKFKQQLQVLRKENKNLKSQLGSANETSQMLVPNTRAIVSESDDDMNLEQIHFRDLRGKVQELQEEVNKLTRENARQQKRIQKFKRKELVQEVQDLVGGKVKKPEETDPEHRMRKLLRKFSDLMLVTTIPEDGSQTCPVCFERLESGKCSALECQHLICHDCLPKMSKGADETIKCAECRSFSSRDEIELVHLTEQDRFDKLLEVAQAWDARDHRGEEETSEEEADESFFNDESGTSFEVGNESKSTDDHSEAVQSASDGDINPPTPPPHFSRPFFESPTKEKRKRMEQLAEERTHKEGGSRTFEVVCTSLCILTYCSCE